LAAFHNLAHDHAAKIAGYRLDRIHFQTGHGQAGNQLVTAYIGVNQATQPLFTKFHAVLLGPELTELRQKAQVIVEEQTQVVHSVSQHGQPLHAHTEGKATIFFGVDAAHAQHIWMHHAAAHDFQPASLLAHTAAVAVTHHALHVDFG